MSYFSMLPVPPKADKPLAAHKVSLYGTRDIIDPSVNLTRMAEINPIRIPESVRLATNKGMTVT